MTYALAASLGDGGLSTAPTPIVNLSIARLSFTCPWRSRGRSRLGEPRRALRIERELLA